MPETKEQENLPKNKPTYSLSRNLAEEAYVGVAEETYYRSPMVPQSYEAPYNSDDIYKKTGDYRIYEDMLNDDQVSVCLQLKKDLVIGSGFDIVSNDEGQEEIVEDLKAALTEDCEIPFLESVEEMLTAYEFGFSISEKVFKIGQEGKLRLKFIKTRHPNSWLLHQDPKGNISKYEQNTSSGNIDVNPKSIIHYVNNRKFQNPYGKSDLRAAYNAWFTKRQVIRYFAIFLEKAASPTPVGKYDTNAPAGTADDLHDVLKKLQAKTALVVPKEIEIDFLEAKNTGEAYSRAIDIFNLFIGRSLFIPDLLGISGGETGGGSYSLGKEQINIFFLHILRRRSAIEKLINDHIIWPMVVYNYGFIDNYPKFKFKPIDDVQALEFAKVWLDAVKSKVYKPTEEEINYFRSIVKFPEGEIEFVEQVMLPQGQQVPPNMQMPNKQEQMPKKIEDEEIESEGKSNFAKVYDMPSGDYHKKVNFKAIETKLNDYDQSILTETAPIIRKMFSDLFDQIQKKKIVQNKSPEKIDGLQIKYLKELKNVLKSSFTQIYKDGQVLAQQELFKSEFAKPLTSQEFLDVLEQEVFDYIGDYQYQIKKKVRTELIAAIKDGRPLSDVINVLDDEGKKLSEVSLERFARTKHTEVMNKARLDFFEKSGVITGYQYSAVLDDRTSDICRGLHGKKFKAGTEPVPPMHFNCRSLLVPITKFEEFEPSEKVGSVPIDEFIQENKGEGFAVN